MHKFCKFISLVPFAVDISLVYMYLACADLEGGSGGSGPPLEFAKLNIANITGNEKN